MKSAKNKDSKQAKAKVRQQPSEPRAKRRFDWAELTLVGILAASIILIAISLIVQLNFNPQGDAEVTLERIADDYYRAYLYPRLLNYDLDHPEQLETYEQSGVPTTYLRQLLNYDNKKQGASAGVFDNQYYQCDTNRTGVRYYPHAPFGPRDYTVDYIWHCSDEVQ